MGLVGRSFSMFVFSVRGTHRENQTIRLFAPYSPTAGGSNLRTKTLIRITGKPEVIPADPIAPITSGLPTIRSELCLKTLCHSPKSLQSMKSPLNRGRPPCNLFWRLKRHPWRGSLLVASGQAFAPRERWDAASFQFASVSLCRGLEVNHGDPAA